MSSTFGLGRGDKARFVGIREIHQKELRTGNIHTQPHGPLIHKTNARITEGEKQVRIHEWQEMVRVHTKPPAGTHTDQAE